MAVLVNEVGKRFELGAGRATTIGRSRDNDIVLEHRSVSRRHAIIQCVQQQFSVKDLSSRNGTWIGNRKISSLRLFEGDIVRFGDIEFRFETSGRSRAKGLRQTSTQRQVSSFGKAIAAIIVLFILGLGSAELILSRQLQTVPSAPLPANRAPDTALGSGAAEPTPQRKEIYSTPSNSEASAAADALSRPDRKRAGDPSRITRRETAPVPKRTSLARAPFSNETNALAGIAAGDIAQAISETDQEHAGDTSWVPIDRLAQECGAGSPALDSSACHAANLVKRIEGGDGGFGTSATVSYADLVFLCSVGAIDSDSGLCLRGYAGIRLEALKERQH